MTNKVYVIGVMAIALGGLVVGTVPATAGGHKPPPPRNGNTIPPPPPPPPPAPPPPPDPDLDQAAPPRAAPTATDYVIYFGFDQASISPDAEAILANAAKDVAGIESANAAYMAQLGDYASKKGLDVHVVEDQLGYYLHRSAYIRPRAELVAYTDTAGSQAYNLRLSERRAKAAADALVALGVKDWAIVMSWKGKANPAVETGDNVREPLNRRVTIHVSGSQ